MIGHVLLELPPSVLPPPVYALCLSNTVSLVLSANLDATVRIKVNFCSLGLLWLSHKPFQFPLTCCSNLCCGVCTSLFHYKKHF